jgi:micrococcal nuclease
MDWSMVFFFLFLFSLVVVIIGTINPKKILPKIKISRIRFFLLSLLASFLLLGISAGTSPTPINTPQPESSSPQSEELGISVGGTKLPESQKFKIVNVVDGDTVKLESGEVVRLIGIDAPETKGECYATEATKKLEELTLDKGVELEKDISETDRYQRLLRYIRIEDNLINEILVREGFAKASTYPPDVKYKDKFIEAERLAREENKGLWGDTCTSTPIPTIKAIATPKPTVKSASTTAPQPIQQQPIGGSYICNCSKTCSQMSSCAEAQYQLNTCRCSARDADDDGIACDSDCQ